MKKKIALVITLSFMILSLIGCGKTKIVHCDRCGKEIEVKESSNVDESWTLYCSDCEKELQINASISEILK